MQESIEDKRRSHAHPDELNSHLLLELAVDTNGPVHFAHASVADLGDNLVRGHAAANACTHRAPVGSHCHQVGGRVPHEAAAGLR